MWKMPAMYVGPYAEGDAELTLELWNFFSGQLSKEDLWPIANLELDLLPCLVDMTMRGVRVNMDRVERTRDGLLKREKEVLKQIKHVAGTDLEIWAAQSLAKAFDKVGLAYPKTEKGAPSFTKLFLQENEHPLAKLVVEARNLNKTSGTFINSIMKHCRADGRIHSHINQIRSDDGGTVSGRMSYSQPNLQQTPARDPEIGPMIRSLFLPEEGDLWAAIDFSQQEPRILTHYAYVYGQMRGIELEGARAFVDRYNNDPDTDFHTMTSEVTGLPRKEAKTCIAEGELVLTDKGLIPIEKITVDHLLWDGEEWVRHEGLVYQGVKEVITYDGLTATPDHEVWVGQERTLPFGLAASRLEKLTRTGVGERPIRFVDDCFPGDRKAWEALPTRRTAKVYDIKNAGPRHRFTVSGRLVHNCGLGILYGMGVNKLAEQLDISVEEAKEVRKQFNDRVPFVKGLMTGVTNRLNQKSSGGSLRSLLGRKCRFDLWEPDTFAMNKALPYKEAIDTYGATTRLKRAYTYKALNRLIQASAADMTKKAMVDLYKMGKLPLLQIHDEIAMSVKDADEAVECATVMENAVPLEVPNKCDIEIGPSWGEAK